MAVASTLGQPQPGALESLAGRYRNDVLGEVTLTLDGDQLRFDAGEFVLEVRTSHTNSGLEYVLDGAPFLGFPIAFSKDPRGAGFTLGSYRFVRQR